MAWLKRVSLFLIVNILIITTISIVLNLLGVKPYITRYGIDYQSLMIFCLIWGMGGAFISLALSKVMAKWMMGVNIIAPDTLNPHHRELLNLVHELSRKSNLTTMPEVGIYESNEINAFATGPSKSNSLVAVSSGLLNRMNRDEIRGVIGHEVAHIANGDMVTMTLIQGVVNAFVMFLARAVAYVITMSNNKDSEESRGTPMSYYLVQFVLEIVFMILGSIVVAWFSRLREFRADKEGARLAGKEKMIVALEGLKKALENNNIETNSQNSIQTLKISNRSGKFLQVFSTHPPLDVRIERLRKLNNVF